MNTVKGINATKEPPQANKQDIAPVNNAGKEADIPHSEAVAKLEDMLVMHCMTNAVLEYQFYLKIPSTNCSAKRSYNKAYIC